jgi:hypothetical protein
MLLLLLVQDEHNEEESDVKGRVGSPVREMILGKGSWTVLEFPADRRLVEF